MWKSHNPKVLSFCFLANQVWHAFIRRAPSERILGRLASMQTFFQIKRKCCIFFVYVLFERVELMWLQMCDKNVCNVHPLTNLHGNMLPNSEHGMGSTAFIRKTSKSLLNEKFFRLLHTRKRKIGRFASILYE